MTRKPRHCDLPFSPLQIKLLENAFDSLDRLFDRETTVVDVHDLLFATAAAMVESELHEVLASTAADLLQMIRNNHPHFEAMRSEALMITDPLRQQIGELLPE